MTMARAGDEPRFVGTARHALVDGLLALSEEVRATSTPRWVSLEAPSGWGKTRLAREFYARLARDQPAPAYWPLSILGSDGPDLSDISARRKKVNPQVTHTPGSLPSYLWWGISCSSRNGVPSVALAQDLAIFEAHAPYLDDAWLRLPRTSRIGEDLRSLAWAGLDEGAMELAGTGVESLLGSAVPGLGLVRWVGQWAWGKHRQSRERGSRLASDEAIESDRSDIADELVAMLTRLARPGLPAVIFIEDLHDADPLLLDVLTRLVSASSAILVISTGWPGHLEELDSLREAMASAQDRLVRISSESPDPLPAPFTPVARLSPLAPDDLATVLHHYYPQVEPLTQAMVIERYPNPLALELFCQIERVARRFTGRELRLSSADLDHLPASIGGLYRQHWNELPATVRHALAVATLGIPVVLDPQLGSSPLWNHDLMVEALAAIELPGAQEIAHSLGSASTAYAWARVVGDTLRRFSEPDQLQVALEEQRSFLFEDEMSAVKTLLATRLAADLEEVEDSREREHGARLLLTLHAEGFVEDPQVLARATLILLDLLRDDPRELVEQVRLAEHALREVDGHSECGMRIRRRLGTAQWGLGRMAAARETFALLTTDLATAHGPEDERVLEARMEHIASAGDDQLGEDLELARALAQDAQRVLGPGHRITLRTGNLVATGLVDLDRHDDALAAYERLHTAARAHLGEHDPLTLILAANLSLELDAVGRLDEAVSLCQQTLATRTRVLGPLHPHSLLSRRNLLAFQMAAGHFTEVMSGYVDLLADAEAGLGPMHPETLTIMGNYVQTLQAMSKVEESVAVQRELVARLGTATGADSPRTTQARLQLGRILTWATHFVEAEEHYAALVADAERAGPRSAPALRARLDRLLLNQTRLGSSAVVEDLGRLATEVAQALGDQDLLTITARSEQAHSLINVGRCQEAIELLHNLIRGSGPDTAATGGILSQHVIMLAYAHRADDDPLTAVRIAQDHLSTALAQHSPIADIVIQFRSEIALCHQAAGHFDEAITTLTDLLGDMAAARGAADTQLVFLRTTLSDCLRDLGRYAESALVAQETHRIALEAFGPVHQSTVRAGVRLLWALQTDDSRADGSHQALEFGGRWAQQVRDTYGEASPTYREVLWPLANSALSVEGRDWALLGLMDDLVTILQSDPQSSTHDRAWARVRRGYVALFAEDPSCVADFQAALAGFEQSLGPEHQDTVSARELLDLARSAFGEAATGSSESE